jgi:hypothetical protein
MKKHSRQLTASKKLKLTAESLRVLTLTAAQLGAVAGGRLTDSAPPSTGASTITKGG